jgi:hypothetical protein
MAEGEQTATPQTPSPGDVEETERFAGLGGRYYRATGIARSSQAADDPTAEQLSAIDLTGEPEPIDWRWEAAVNDYVPVYSTSASSFNAARLRRNSSCPPGSG